MSRRDELLLDALEQLREGGNLGALDAIRAFRDHLEREAEHDEASLAKAMEPIAWTNTPAPIAATAGEPRLAKGWRRQEDMDGDCTLYDNDKGFICNRRSVYSSGGGDGACKQHAEAMRVFAPAPVIPADTVRKHATGCQLLRDHDGECGTTVPCGACGYLPCAEQCPCAKFPPERVPVTPGFRPNWKALARRLRAACTEMRAHVPKCDRAWVDITVELAGVRTQRDEYASEADVLRSEIARLKAELADLKRTAPVVPPPAPTTPAEAPACVRCGRPTKYETMDGPMCRWQPCSLPATPVQARLRGCGVGRARGDYKFRCGESGARGLPELCERCQPITTPVQVESDEDKVTREPGCQCHIEEGDSPCRVHGEDEEPVQVDPVIDVQKIAIDVRAAFQEAVRETEEMAAQLNEASRRKSVQVEPGLPGWVKVKAGKINKGGE